MIVLINTDGKRRGRRPNIDGVTSDRFFWVKHWEKLSRSSWAIDVYAGKVQCLVAVGEAASMWLNRDAARLARGNGGEEVGNAPSSD